MPFSEAAECRSSNFALDRTWPGQPFFRDDSHVDGTLAGDDHTSLGFCAGTADCHPGPLAAYLIAGLDQAGDGSRIYEIGGADQVSYGDLIREYARQRGLRRLIIRVPVLTPRLSSLWLGLVTPLYARVGRKLIESIRHPTIVRHNRARREFAIKPIGHRESIAAILSNEDKELVNTRWSDALSAAGNPGRNDVGPAERCFVDSRVAEVDLPPAQSFGPIRRIGGVTGWYYGNRLWRLRGAIDLFLGGVGMRRRAP